MLNVEIARKTGIHVMVLAGEFDLTEKDRVSDYFQTVLAEAPKGLIVDLSNVSLIDSSGIGLLISNKARLNDIGARYALVLGNNGHLIKKFSNLGLFDASGIERFACKDDACQAIGQQP
ncbi:MAG TPA: STAS domain-containing protein [Candidatus Aquicultor sp.]